MGGGGREWEKEKEGERGIMGKGGKEKAGQVVNLMTAF